MSKHAITRKVLVIEGVGFGLMICILWLTELLDLPHKVLAAPATPFNWRESLFESILLLGLAIGTLTWTRRALARITYLEGFLRVCSFCKKIHAGDEWIPIEEYISDHSAALFSHGLCPQCMKRYYPQYANPPSGKSQT